MCTSFRIIPQYQILWKTDLIPADTWSDVRGESNKHFVLFTRRHVTAQRYLENKVIWRWTQQRELMYLFVCLFVCDVCWCWHCTDCHSEDLDPISCLCEMLQGIRLHKLTRIWFKMQVFISKGHSAGNSTVGPWLYRDQFTRNCKTFRNIALEFFASRAKAGGQTVVDSPMLILKHVRVEQ